MKKLLTIICSLIILVSCSSTDTKLPEAMQFEIPDSYTQVDNT